MNRCQTSLTIWTQCTPLMNLLDACNDRFANHIYLTNSSNEERMGAAGPFSVFMSFFFCYRSLSRQPLPGQHHLFKWWTTAAINRSLRSSGYDIVIRRVSGFQKYITLTYKRRQDINIWSRKPSELRCWFYAFADVRFNILPFIHAPQHPYTRR